MNTVNIESSEFIASYIVKLEEGKQPLFGRFTPQHMVEHLIYTIQGSTGEVVMSFVSKEENLPALRAFLYSEKEIRPGAKAPFLEEELPSLVCTSLEEAKIELILCLNKFHGYYASDKNAKHMNPIFGLLNYDEWLRFHTKHFTHHFKQFELI